MGEQEEKLQALCKYKDYEIYFKYDKQTKEVKFYEKIHFKNELVRLGLEKDLVLASNHLDICQIQIWQLCSHPQI